MTSGEQGAITSEGLVALGESERSKRKKKKKKKKTAGVSSREMSERASERALRTGYQGAR